VAVTAAKLMSGALSVSFWDTAADGQPECRTSKRGAAAPELFDATLGSGMDTPRRSGPWRVVDGPAGGTRTYVGNVTQAMLRSALGRQRRPASQHAATVVGGVSPATVVACLLGLGLGLDTDRKHAVLGEATAEVCLDARPARQDGAAAGCAVVSASVTGVYAAEGGDVHVALETRARSGCTCGPGSSEPVRLAASGASAAPGGGAAVAGFSVLPMGRSAERCEEEAPLARGDCAECIQSWDVVAKGVRADPEGGADLSVSLAFATVGGPCADKVSVQLAAALDAGVPGRAPGPRDWPASAPAPAPGTGGPPHGAQPDAPPTTGARTGAGHVRATVTTFAMLGVTFHVCAKRPVPAGAASGSSAPDLGAEEKACPDGGDITVVVGGVLSHEFSTFADGRLVSDGQTASLCFTPNVQRFGAGAFEISWGIVQKDPAPALGAVRGDAPSSGSGEQGRLGRDQTGQEHGKRYPDCHGFECNGTIIIPVFAGCRIGYYFMDHLDCCVPWPIYGAMRFLRIAWVIVLTLGVACCLSCVACYKTAFRTREKGRRHRPRKTHLVAPILPRH
jgi:hypothetical protein